MIKGKPCTICKQPDDYSDETVCHNCIEKWKKVLEGKERDKIMKIVKNILNKYGHVISLHKIEEEISHKTANGK